MDSLTTIFTLARSSLGPHDLKTDTPSISYLNTMQSVLFDNTPVGVDRLAQRPSDVLVPSMHIMSESYREVCL